MGQKRPDPGAQVAGQRKPRGVPRCPDPTADAGAPEPLRRRHRDGEDPDPHAGLLLYACQPAARRQLGPVARFLGRNESSLRRWRDRWEWRARAQAPDGERWAAYLLGRMYPALLTRSGFTRIIPGAEDVLALFQGQPWARGDDPGAGPQTVPAPQQAPATPAPRVAASAAPAPPAAPPAAPAAPAQPAPSSDPRDVLPRALIGHVVRKMQQAQASAVAGQPVDLPFAPKNTSELLAVIRVMDRREQDLRDQAPPVTSDADAEDDLDGLRVQRALATGDERVVLAAVLDEADEVAFLARRLLGQDDGGPGRLEVLNGGRA